MEEAASQRKPSGAARDAGDGVEDTLAAEPDQNDAEQPLQESDWGVEADAATSGKGVKAGTPAAGRKPAKPRASRAAAAVESAPTRSPEKEAPPGAWHMQSHPYKAVFLFKQHELAAG